MNAAEYKALQINKIIKESDAYKLSVSLKNKITSKYKLEEEEIINLQQELVTLSHFDTEQYETKKEEYLTRKEKFKNDPLISSYIDALNAVSRLINGVKNIIEAEIV